MFRLLLILLTSLLLSAAPEPKVFICTGSMSYAYHFVRQCKGLAKCTRSVHEIPVSEAQKMGRKACGFCKRTAIFEL